MSLKLTSITQQYPTASAPLYKDFCAEFAQNKVHAILGCSGSGKTTLLNVIANLCKYTGNVECGKISYVFQDGRLIDEITVENNLKLVLRAEIKDKNKLNEEIKKYLSLADIDQYAKRYPSELSGGEKQRVALARAFAYPSQTLLMDEPFNSLDYGVKAKLLTHLLSWQKISPRTTLFVTHNADEALAIADEIYLLSGTPATLQHLATLPDNKEERDLYSDKYIKIKRMLVEKLTNE